ncbi:MAG: DinB family protein [Balneolaceae bacterium]|nr:DinB family protein [Balneolaceae bacterium]
MNDLTKLVPHCIWANKNWIEFLKNETPDDLHLRELMSHILLSEQVWFQRISRRELNRKIWQIFSFEKLNGLHQKNQENYMDLLDDDLNKKLTFERFNGESGEAFVRDILLHLCTHGFHHRGQMSAHVSSIGLTPINTDFLMYRSKAK